MEIIYFKGENMKFKFFLISVFWMVLTIFGQAGENYDLTYGKKLLNDKIYDVAITQFELFIEKYPSSINNAEAYYYIAKSYKGLDDSENSLKYYQKVILNFPSSEFCELAIEESGKILEEKKELDKAARFYLQYKNYFPKSRKMPKNLYRAIALFYQTGQLDEAIDQINFLKTKYPKNLFTAKSLLIMAKIHSARNEFLVARKIYNDLINITSDKSLLALIYYDFSNFYFENNKYGDAKKILEKIVKSFKKYPQYQEAALKLAKIYLDETRYQESLATIPTIEQADSLAYMKERLLKSLILTRQEKLQEALEILEKYDPNHNNLEVSLREADILEKLSQYSKGAEILRISIEKNTEIANILELKKAILKSANLSFRANQASKAVAYLNKFNYLFKEENEQAFILYLSGKFYFQTENYYEAFAALNKLLNSNFKHHYLDHACYLAAEALYNLKDFGQAEIYFNRLKTSFPASNFTGLALNRLKKIRAKKIDNNQALLELSEIMQNSANQEDLTLEWAKYYFYTLKEYEKSLALITNYQSPNKENESLATIIYLGSLLKNENLSDEEKNSKLKNKLALIKKDAQEKKFLLYLLEIFKETTLYTNSDKSLKKLYQNYLKFLYENKLDNNQKEVYTSYLEMLYNNQDYLNFLKISDLYLSIVSSKENQEKIQYLRAKALENMEKIDQARTSFRKIIDANQSSYYQFRSILHYLDIFAASLDEKLRLLDQIRDEYFYTELASNYQTKKAELLTLSDNFFKAEKVYQQMIADYNSGRTLFEEKQPDILAIYNKLANLYYQQNQYDKAEFYYKKALSLDEGNLDALEILNKLSEIYKIKKDMVSLEDNLKLISQFSQGENNNQADLALANIEFEKENYKSAHKKLVSILKKDPLKKDKILVEAKIIQCLYRLKKIDEASKKADLFEEKYEEDDSIIKTYLPLFLLEKADAYMKFKNYDKALDGYEDIIDDYEKAEVYPKALYGKSMVYYNIGKKDKAIKIWQQLSKYFKTKAVSVNSDHHLGAIYMNREDYDNALLHLEKIIKFEHPHNLKQSAYKHLIDLYKMLGLTDAALRTLREYIKKYPEDPSLFYKKIEIGKIYQANEEYDLALKYFNNLLYQAKGEDEAAVQFYIAESYMKRGAYKKAISEFLKVNYLIKNYSPTRDWQVTALYNSALCYEELKEYQKAIELLNKVLKKYGKSTSYGKQATKVIRRIKSKM